MTLESALDRVSNMLGVTLDWMELRDFLPPHAEPRLRKSALASSFVAALELARLGKAELQQDDTFGRRSTCAGCPPDGRRWPAPWRPRCSRPRSR